MTTTGSARYHNVLKDIGPRIVIVEEAAEVLESHIIISLSKHAEHLILIGDHHQLKPKNNVNELERNYDMNVSLFERLINNKFDYVTLSRQHRMRPEISCLMKHFYETKIEDDNSVLKRDYILGVKQDIAFINHSILEDHLVDADNRSKVNKYEGKYLVQLAKFFIRQHYQTSRITFLATYSGQTSYIRQELKIDNLSNA
jgi:superfamily I DNA and/or RNA helicase